MIRMSQERTKLETVIPLRTPFIINIDPSALCNFACKFCYQSDKENYYKIPGAKTIMPWSMYRNIINDLQEFEDKIKVIRLYAFGEPLINSEFPRMVKYALDSGKVDRVDTTTNGTFLTNQLVKDIVSAGLSRINISIEGVNPQQYKDFSGYSLNWTKFIDTLSYLYENRKQCEVFIKINGDIISEEDQEVFKNTFGPIADGIAIERAMSCWNSFDSKIPINQNMGLYGQEIKEKLVCPYVFYSFTIHADGVASTCFLDWNKQLVFSNVRDFTVKQIWEHNTFKEFKKLMLMGERKNFPICSSCGQLSHGACDDIDQYAKMLLEKI